MTIAIIHQFQVIESIKVRKCWSVNDTLRKHIYYRMETLPKMRQKKKTVFFSLKPITILPKANLFRVLIENSKYSKIPKICSGDFIFVYKDKKKKRSRIDF